VVDQVSAEQSTAQMTYASSCAKQTGLSTRRRKLQYTHVPVPQRCVDAIRQLLDVQRRSRTELQAPRQLLRGNLARRERYVNRSRWHESRGVSGACLKQSNTASPPFHYAILVQRGHDV